MLPWPNACATSVAAFPTVSAISQDDNASRRLQISGSNQRRRQLSGTSFWRCWRRWERRRWQISGTTISTTTISNITTTTTAVQANKELNGTLLGGGFRTSRDAPDVAVDHRFREHGQHEAANGFMVAIAAARMHFNVINQFMRALLRQSQPLREGERDVLEITSATTANTCMQQR